MPYLLELDETSSEKLEALAERERLPATKLIERVVLGHLGSASEHDFPLREKTRPDSAVAGQTDLYRWDEEKGTIRFVPSNRRVFVMNAHAWSAIEASLFSNIEKEAPRFLSAWGHAYGRMTALDYRSATHEPENIKSYFEYLSLAAGWGKFSLSGDLQGGSKITIKVVECAFCGSRNASEGRKDPCWFLTGVCKGVADTVFDSSHDARETKCFAKGNDSCDIVLTRLSQPESGAAGWSWSEHPSPISAWR